MCKAPCGRGNKRVLLHRVRLEVDLEAVVLLRLRDAQLVAVEGGAAGDAVHREALAATDQELADLAVLRHVVQVKRSRLLGRVGELGPALANQLRRWRQAGTQDTGAVFAAGGA